MKKAFIIIATAILAIMVSISVSAQDNESFYNDIDILTEYANCLNSGRYYTTDTSQHTVMINNVECHQKMDGKFVYNNDILFENVEEIIGYNILKKYIGEFYIHQVQNGKCIYKLGKMHNVVITDTYDMCYVTEDGKLMCGGEVIYENVSTIDNLQTNQTVIYQNYGTAITVDSDFVYIYYLGEIREVINIHTGNHPKG